MGAFWSGTDTNTMTEYKNSNWSAFLVVNVREEYKFRVQYWHPYEMGEDIDLTVLTNKTKERAIPKGILKEIEDKCTERTTVAQTGGYNYGGYSRYSGYQATLWSNQQDVPDKDKNDELTDLLDEFESYVECGYQYYGNQTSIQEYPIAFLIEQLELGNQRYCEGAITYDKYTKAINEFNDTLEKLEGKTSPKIRVVLFSQNELLDKVMELHPHDFITIDGEPIDDLYLARTDKRELKEYNAGFNLGGKS
jgi:predicted AlkP superfamily phosphohydrolase/phosphomutase